MVFLRWFAAALFVVCIPVFLVLTNVRIATNWEAVYGYSLSEYDASQVTGIERSQLDRAVREIIWYFRYAERDALLDIRVQDGDEVRPLFNQREVLHMRDVLHLVQGVNRVHEFAFIYIVAYIAAVYLWSRERSLRHLARQAMMGGGLTVMVLGATALFVVVGFDTFWTQFHLISFDNDLWLLDPRRDHLIQMFPTGFWFDVTLALGMISMVQGGLIALAGVGYMWWQDRTQRRRRRRRRVVPAAAEARQA